MSDTESGGYLPILVGALILMKFISLIFDFFLPTKKTVEKHRKMTTRSDTRKAKDNETIWRGQFGVNDVYCLDIVAFS